MNIDWTHRKIKITDIRKVKNFYVISVVDKKITSPLFVEHKIFEGRLKSYYLKNNHDTYQFNRNEVLDVDWNMVINKGYFIKIDSNDHVEKIYKDKDKFYISFLEIDGPLGTHISN